MQLSIFNTFGREIQPIKPIVPGKIGFYACGPTVYDFQHIGNLRTYIFEDVLRRALEYTGLEVTHIMNVTDVGHLTDDADAGEDKMVKSARERKMSVWEIAEYYAGGFFWRSEASQRGRTGGKMQGYRSHRRNDCPRGKTGPQERNLRLRR